jgi:hypothetical protein
MAPNNGTFNKSNWSRTVSDPHSVQYMPAAKGGIANPTTVASNSVLTTTIAAAFQFKGNGPLEVSLPFGQQILNSATAAATSISLGESWLSGSIASSGYAAGVHPSIIYKLVNSGAAQTLIGCDLLAVQY